MADNSSSRSKRLSIRLFSEELDILRDMAKETGLSESDIVRLALRNLAKTREKGSLIWL